MRRREAATAAGSQVTIFGGLALFLEGSRLLRDEATGLFLLMSAVLCAGEALFSQDGDSSTVQGSRSPARLAHLSGLALALMFVVALVEHARAGQAVGRWSVWLPVGLMGAGAALRVSAIRALGPFFVSTATVAQGQPLVISGPFRWVRHPSELGLLCWALGAAWILQSGLAAMIWLGVLVPATVLRIWHEDRVLQAAYGETFVAYARQTPAVLPTLRPLRAEL